MSRMKCLSVKPSDKSYNYYTSLKWSEKTTVSSVLRTALDFVLENYRNEFEEYLSEKLTLKNE